ncbi:MAG: hypothetical protein HY698_20460 [Deltaproteobacteria bacterium]|nr:hypothetical protein [Deltaproteobacteria bacterium]
MRALNAWFHAGWFAVALGVMGCTGDGATESDGLELGGDSVDSKVDSLHVPTQMGELQLLYPRTEKLTPLSRQQAYTFVGTKGWHVSFVLKSGAFRTYLRIKSPSGRWWNLVGKRDPNNGAWYSTLETDLPASGKYTLIVSSIGPRTGEYTLSAEAEVFCGGIAAFPCPSYLKCLYDGNYPDAGGTCVKPETCYTADDCVGLPNMLLCVGAWTCEREETGPGTCKFQCGASSCRDHKLDACENDPNCHLVEDCPTCEPGTICPLRPCTLRCEDRPTCSIRPVDECEKDPRCMLEEDCPVCPEGERWCPMRPCYLKCTSRPCEDLSKEACEANPACHWAIYFRPCPPPPDDVPVGDDYCKPIERCEAN